MYNWVNVGKKQCHVYHPFENDNHSTYKNGDLWFVVDTTILVGGAITILKNMKVNGKDDIPYMKWKIIHSCLKPPTRCIFRSHMLMQYYNIYWPRIYLIFHYLKMRIISYSSLS